MNRHRMQKIIWLLGIYVLGTPVLNADSWPCSTSHSFMFTRPLDQAVASADFFMWDELISDKDGPHQAAVRILPMYQQSRKSPGTAAYFLLNCKQTILVAGDKAPNSNERDVRAEWLKLPPDFSGTLSLNPTQRQVGVTIDYNQGLRNAIPFDWFDRIWFVLSATVTSVKNDLRPCETRTSGQPPTFPYTILDAINQPSYLYGKISREPLQRAGLAEVNIGLGTSWFSDSKYLLWYQTTLDIPGCSGTCPEFLFSPVIGLNGHWAWSNKLAIGLPLHPDCAWYTCQWIIDFTSRYYFPHLQMRTLDLFGKPWGRYLLLVDEVTSNTIPAVNVTTQWVKSHPHGFVNFLTGLRFGFNCWDIELGYALWAHRAETLQFARPACETSPNPVFFYGISNNGGSGTASTSNITTLGPQDPTFVHLYANNLSLNSGASQSVFTQAFHFEFGYHFEEMYAALGMFIEQPHRNAALETWGAWASFGISF